LRQRLPDEALDALLVSHPENRRYLSGFTGSAGWLLVSARLSSIAVDFRYVEQAKLESPDFEVLHIKGDISHWLPGLATDFGIKKLGFEANQITVATYQQLCNSISQSQHQLQFVPTSGIVESIRAIKEPAEIKSIIEAAALTDATLDYARTIVQPGMTEKQIAWELEEFAREKGSETIPFGFIVASGPNSAMPHAKPTERIILKGAPVILDIGARVNGYCSDLSRTLIVGDEDNMFPKIYNIVLGAQLTALATIVAGMSGEQADKLSRNIIEQANYGEAFGHGLGHGIGLEAHELPRLGHGSADMLAEGMVFSVEPGVYIAGWGGVRIEDTVVVENGKIRSLTQADKTPNI
jgi:Xaa-Pro aminopeptidase